MDTKTLLAMYDFGHARLLESLQTIEKSGADPAKVLAWRPGAGRAHIAWQAMHCAATLDNYVNARLHGGKPGDPDLVARYGGGSTPADDHIPDLATIRQALEKHGKPFRDYLAKANASELSQKKMFGKTERTVGEALVLLIWHETHHQGQIHLTWNLYKAAHGIK